MEVAILIAFCLVMFVLVVKAYDKKNPAFLVTEYHPELEADYPEKKMEEPKKKDISEPVYAFVRTVKENPKRFKLKRESCLDSTYGNTYTFTDKQENKTWCVSLLWSLYGKGPSLIGCPNWITKDERVYIYDTLQEVFSEDRRNKLHQIQRERMKRVYK